ncbi:pirin family protein [Candidatus Uhrbacteria bacterium]|nr:pirin family protein [Candidatus Uhrbacteria bacterium]
MPSLLHLSVNRGFRDHDWLQTAHSFSFGNYWDPAKMGFGLLRVLNDDTIQGGVEYEVGNDKPQRLGFGMHPHRDMEIVTIPLSGQIEHKDNHGHHGVIGAGDVQVMSAGTGITHSEFNASETEAVSVLQMWVETDALDHDPRYEDRKFLKADKNTFQLLVSPDERDGSLMIHQQAFFNLGEFDADHVTRYVLRDAKHGVYIFVIEGEIEVDGNNLGRRDAIGVWGEKEVEIKTKKDSKVLLIEVPMR